LTWFHQGLILKIPIYAYSIRKYEIITPPQTRHQGHPQTLASQYHLTYDQARYIAKEVRRALGPERPKMRKRVAARLCREEKSRLIAHAYGMKGAHGLLIKTLFRTGARVTEFVNI
jgi:hypothetical protein